ncbi:hypothetical protein F1880_008943 [Penicillium rolfsii]|nr:hypothetical protein F1880_008943 [Penicillium rolfsii]
MDPIVALGVASGVVQMVDFISKLVSNTYKIYNSADGALENNVAIKDIAINLQELIEELAPPPPSKEDKKFLDKGKKPPRTKAEAELDSLRMQGVRVAQELFDAITGIEMTMPRRKWSCFRQALVSVWSEKKIRALETRIEKIRKQLDTTLLVCLKQRLEHLTANSTSSEDNDIRNFILDSRQWQANLLSEIQLSNSEPEKERGLSIVSAHLDQSARQAKKARFCKSILARLNYIELPHREEEICEAYRETFDWLFKYSDDSKVVWPNFGDWLKSETEHRIYWITGKAGSGKSTLMKYLYRDHRTTKSLKQWAESHRTFTAAFYFWNSGTKLQMSRMGLLQSLLYQIFQTSKNWILSSFERRWEIYDAHCGGLQPFSWTELKMVFDQLISIPSCRFFFAVDGLDEMDGDHKELVDLIIAAANFPNVKICVASRPWRVFEDAFGSKPSLFMENLTQNDIKHYVTSKFNGNTHYSRLQSRDAKFASELIDTVVAKASGVFLWVYLVVDSLLRGLSNADRISDLQQRLDALPSELEALFGKILNNLEPSYYQHACQLIRIVESAKEPISILELSFADEDDVMSAINAPVEPLSTKIQEDRAIEMTRRLNSRCKGFLEVKRVRGWSPVAKVTYLHRTAKDFIREQYWKQIVSVTEGTFDPQISLSNAFLFRLKTRIPSHMNSAVLWQDIRGCLHYASGVEPENDHFRFLYLDEDYKLIRLHLYTGPILAGRLGTTLSWSMHAPFAAMVTESHQLRAIATYA